MILYPSHNIEYSSDLANHITGLTTMLTILSTLYGAYGRLEIKKGKGDISILLFTYLNIYLYQRDIKSLEKVE